MRWLLAALIVSIASAAAQPNWMVKVQSTYVDEKTKKPVTVTGSGFLAKLNGKFVVVCDSHLSQGKEGLRLTSSKGTVSAKPASRVSNNDTDLEIIEIDDPGIPESDYFAFDGERFRMSKNRLGAGTVQLSKTGFMPVAPWSRGHPSPMKEDQALPSVGSLMIEDGTKRLQGHLSERWDGGELISESLITEGMSGEPLLELDGDSLVVAGLTKAYHRRWKRSYFSTPKQLKELATAFASGKTGPLTPTRWIYDGLTCRDYGNGTLEIVSEVVPSGGSESGDGGGSESGDGGISLSSQVNLPPGMTWQGSPTLAFKAAIPDRSVNVPAVSYVDEKGETVVVKKAPYPKAVKGQKTAVVYASMTGRDLLERMAIDKTKIEPLGPNLDFYELFETRVRSSFFFMHHDRPTECYIDTSAPDGTIRIRLPSMVDLTGTHRVSKPWIIEINRDGTVRGTGQTRFEPFLPLEDPATGTKALVDIRGLFFADFSRVTDATALALPLIAPQIIMKIGESKDWPITCRITDNERIFRDAETYYKPTCTPEPPKTGAEDFLSKLADVVSRIWK